MLYGQLCSLREDLGEPQDLMAEEQERAAAMRQLLQGIRASAGSG